MSVSQVGALAEVASVATTAPPYGLALTDFNRDGTLDAATVGQHRDQIDLLS